MWVRGQRPQLETLPSPSVSSKERGIHDHHHPLPQRRVLRACKQRCSRNQESCSGWHLTCLEFVFSLEVLPQLGHSLSPEFIRLFHSQACYPAGVVSGHFSVGIMIIKETTEDHKGVQMPSVTTRAKDGGQLSNVPHSSHRREVISWLQGGQHPCAFYHETGESWPHCGPHPHIAPCWWPEPRDLPLIPGE